MKKKLRFQEHEVCMEDVIEPCGDRDEILSGYLCAYGPFVNMTDFEERVDRWLEDNEEASVDDCYINFYPCYNIETKEFYVEVSYYLGAINVHYHLDLTEKELDYLKETFFRVYFNCPAVEADDAVACFLEA